MAGTIATMLVRSRRGSARLQARARRAHHRDHLRAFAQRVKVAEREVLIKGSKDELLRTFVAVGSGKLVGSGVLCSVQKWRAEADETENYTYAIAL